jgi:hypothetical protein
MREIHLIKSLPKKENEIPGKQNTTPKNPK